MSKLLTGRLYAQVVSLLRDHGAFARALVLGTCLVAGFGIALLLWDAVRLPFSNPLCIVGPLAKISFNPQTNLVRVFLFIGTPTLLFLLSLFVPVVRRLFVKPATAQHIAPETAARIGERRPRKLLTIAIIAVALFCVFCFAFGEVVYFFQKDYWAAAGEAFDIFHEGEFLTPAYIFSETGKLWTGSLFAHGAFHDVFTAYLGWEFFGYKTIGAMRVAVDFLQASVRVFFVGFLAVLAYILSGRDMKRFLVMLAMLLVAYFILGRYVIIERRDIFLFVSAAMTVLAIWRHSRVLFFVAGLGSALTCFSSIDRGAYITGALLLLGLALLVWPLRQDRSRVYYAKYLGGGIAVGWLLFALAVGAKEFAAFFENTAGFVQLKDMLDSYVYPKPRLFSLAPHVVVLTMLGFSVLYFVYKFVSVYLRDPRARALAYVHGLLVVIAVAFMRSIFRSSEHEPFHIFYASTFALILLGFTFCLMLRGRERWQRLLFVNLLALGVIGCVMFWPQVEKCRGFKKRVTEFVAKSDDEFLRQTRANAGRLADALVLLKRELSGQTRLFSYTSETGLPYLLRKLPDGTNPVVWFCASLPRQEKLLQELSQSTQERIIFSSGHWANAIDGIPNAERFPRVHQYILRNYRPLTNVAGYYEIYGKMRGEKPATGI